MGWLVVLNGPSATLARLTNDLRGQGLDLAQADGRWVLKSAAYDSLADATRIKAAAEDLAARLSAAARLLLGSDSAITIGGIEEHRADGSRHAYMFASAGFFKLTGRGNLTVGGVGQKPAPSPESQTVALAVLAGKDATVTEVLHRWDRAALSWSELYNIYEIIAKDLGPSALSKLPGITAKGVSRFKHSANSPATAGKAARHGVQKSQPPTDPMSLEEAARFVEQLMRAWLARKVL